MRRSCFLVALCSLLSSGILTSQTGQAVPAEEPHQFTVKTELVLVPTVVTDKRGNAIHGLTKSDFQVLDNKAPQEIKIFEEITTSSERPAPVTSNAGEFTNRVLLGSESKPRRLTIIAFDLINTPTLQQGSARKELLEFLADMANSNEPTAVYSITRSGAKVITDFTTDPAVLANALKKMKLGHNVSTSTTALEGSTHEAPNSTIRSESMAGFGQDSMNRSVAAAQSAEEKTAAILYSLEQFAADAELNMTSSERRFAVMNTIDAMNQIAQACAAIPGRKSLIWVTGGFPFDVSPTDMMLNPGYAPTNIGGRRTVEDVMPDYLRLWRALNNAQVSVYPVDVRGSTNPYLVGPSIRNPGSRYEHVVNYQNRQTNDTDIIFANATGGVPFFGSNDLKRGFAQAFKDSTSYYLIGYYIKPVIKPKDPKISWRQITVKSPRKDLDIRARSGYFYSATPVDVELSREHDLSAGIYSPVDFTAITLTARWKQITPAPDPKNKHVEFELLLPANFGEVDEANDNHMVCDIVAQPKTLEGKPVGAMLSRRMDAHLNPAQLQEVRERGLTYANVLDLPPGNYVVRFVVRDGLSGRMGSVAAPLAVQ